MSSATQITVMILQNNVSGSVGVDAHFFDTSGNLLGTHSATIAGHGTAVGNTKAAKAYDRTVRYRKGQAMTHPVFGRGEVTAVLEPQKIDVLFGSTTRRLIHAQD